MKMVDEAQKTKPRMGPVPKDLCVLAVTLVFGRDFMVKKMGKVSMD